MTAPKNPKPYGLPISIPASQALANLLDARGAVSVTERVGVMKRVRDLAIACAKEYLASRERLGFPLLPKGPDGPPEGVAAATEL